MEITNITKKNIKDTAKMLSNYWGSIGEDYSPRYAENYLKKGHKVEIVGDKFFIAKEKEEVVGSLSMTLYDDNSGELRDFYVKPEYRNKGYGKRLLKHMLKWARKKKLRMVFAKALKTTTGILKKEGFKLEGKSKRFFIKEDAYFMTKHFRR